jgi:hypothetical protein
MKRLVLVIFILFIGCASKHIEIDGNKVTADIVYFWTDQNTNGFDATLPNGVVIKFDAQGSQAKTEVLLEMLKAFNSLPK